MVNVALGNIMAPLARMSAPASFGRGRTFVTTLTVPDTTPSSLKLFLTTYCVGFVLVSAWIA